MSITNDRTAHSATLDAAAAKATAAYAAVENKIAALQEALTAMSALDDIGCDERLDEEERRMIYGWLPAQGYADIRARIAAETASLPALEEAVRVAEVAVNDDEAARLATEFARARAATPAETGAMLGLKGPATVDNLVFLVGR